MRLNNRDEIRQECALKVIKAVPEFDVRKGNAFAFLWTVICNTCRTHAKRLGKPSLSLSTDEVIKHEAEVSAKEVFETPENRHVLNSIGKELIHVMNNGNGFHPSRKKGHTRACRILKSAIADGDLFFDRNKVVRELKKAGLSNKEIQYYCQYSMVTVRMQLLNAKENSLALAHSKIGTGFPPIADS